MIITTCGYGNSGASAVLDFLKGYDEIRIIDDVEFQIVHMPDGLLDLRNALLNPNGRLGSTSAIYRFERLKYSNFAKGIKKLGCNYDSYSDEFINTLDAITWNGYSVFDPIDLFNYKYNDLFFFIRKICLHYARKFNLKHRPFFHKRYFSIMDKEQFDCLAKDFISKLLKGISVNSDEKVVLDMLFSTMDSQRGVEFFDDNVKTIIVSRDPRDVYLYSNLHPYVSAFLPYDDVNQFIQYFRMLRKNEVKNKGALYINFEDLIYNYYETTSKIMSYLEIPSRPANEFKYFNPDISVRNTFPFQSSENKKCVRSIESELSDYLYDFPSYKSPVDKRGI